MAWTKAKIAAVTAVALLFCGGVGTVAHHLWATRHREQVVTLTPRQPAPAAAGIGFTIRPPRMTPSFVSTGPITGIVLGVDGKPLKDAEILLATVSTPVSVYGPVKGNTQSARTAADGSFTLTPTDQPLAIVARSSAGIAQALVTDLKATPHLTLEPWARLEGTLRAGSRVLPGEKIHLSRYSPLGNWDSWHTMHDIETRTDAAGHFVFDQITPGPILLGYIPKGQAQAVRNYVAAAGPGTTTTFDIGGNGRRVEGRVDPVMAECQFREVSLYPQRPDAPAAMSQLPEPLRSAAINVWWNSPQMQEWQAHSQPIHATMDADGGFAIDDVPAAKYQVQIVCAVAEPGSHYAETAAEGHAAVTIPGDAAGPGDPPLNIGKVSLKLYKRLKVGQEVPDIQGNDAKGAVSKLSGFRGKCVLLHIWSPNDRVALQQMDDLKALFDHFCGDGRLTIVGANREGSPEAVKKALDGRAEGWPQIIAPSVPDKYSASPSPLFLIAPDGKLLAKNIDVGQAYALVDKLLGAPTADARVRVERLPRGDRQPAGAFKIVPKPSREGTVATTFRAVDGMFMSQSGPLACLTDGRMGNSDDAPDKSVFFDQGTLEGRLRADLGKVISVGQINTYSRHKSTRAPQVYEVYGSDGSGTAFDPEPRFGVDPVTRGWALIADVDTRNSAAPGGQCGVSIGDPGVSLGKYRYLLFVTFVTETDDPWGHTFYQEINVIAQK